MTAREDRTAQTRQALLDAARQVFAERGYLAANIADIVEAAGRARGTFYLHFENRTAIFAALLEEVAELMIQQGRLIWRSDHPARSVLESVQVFLTDFAQQADLWRIFDEITATEREAAALRDRWTDTFTARVRTGIDGSQHHWPAALDTGVAAELLVDMLDETARRTPARRRARDSTARDVALVWSRALGYPTGEIEAGA